MTVYRPCLGCGETVQDRRRCEACQRTVNRARDARRGNRHERGYGADHERARAAMLPTVLAGQAKCARCGDPIAPDEPWDAGHAEGRVGYRGPEHTYCNRGNKDA